MKRKQRELECQLNLQLNKPFNFNDLPKNPQTASERVLVFCCSLFTPSPKPNVPRRTIPISRIGVIRSNLDFNRRDFLPRGQGAIDCFERDLNLFQQELLDEYWDM
jgi:hypothetical protein